MNLTAQELSYGQSQGLYVREKCDGCGTILNQSVRYTIAGKAEVYCSAKCSDGVFFEDQLESKKESHTSAFNKHMFFVGLALTCLLCSLG